MADFPFMTLMGLWGIYVESRSSISPLMGTTTPSNNPYKEIYKEWSLVAPNLGLSFQVIQKSVLFRVQI